MLGLYWAILGSYRDTGTMEKKMEPTGIIVVM